MGGVVRVVLAVSCAFVGSFVVSTFVTSLALGAAFDTTSETAKATSNTWLGLSSLGLWVVLSWLYWRARSARRIFGWMFLTCGLATLALPVGMPFLPARLRRTRDAELALTSLKPSRNRSNRPRYEAAVPPVLGVDAEALPRARNGLILETVDGRFRERGGSLNPAPRWRAVAAARPGEQAGPAGQRPFPSVGK